MKVSDDFLSVPCVVSTTRARPSQAKSPFLNTSITCDTSRWPAVPLAVLPNSRNSCCGAGHQVAHPPHVPQRTQTAFGQLHGRGTKAVMF